MGGSTSSEFDPLTYEYDDGGCSREFIVNKKGLRLAVYAWAPGGLVGSSEESPSRRPDAVVVFFHGLGGHSRSALLAQPGFKFENSWAQKFCHQNLVVIALDQQSHGCSEGWCGLRCTVETFEDFIDDAEQLLDLIHKGDLGEGVPTAGVPVFVMGTSMGGCLAGLVAERVAAGSLGGAILISPMASLEKAKEDPVNRWLLPLVGVASAYTPNLALGKREPNFFEEIHASFESDKLAYHGKTRARMAAECLRAVDLIQERAKEFTCPMLIVHSKRDTQCEKEGSEMLMELAASCHDKTLLLVDEGWHILQVEPGQEKVFESVLGWIQRRL